MRLNQMAGIFALAFLVRLIFAVQWHATPYGAAPLLDALLYHNWAQEIVQGHLSHGRAFYMMPLYPYTLGLLYSVLGHSLWIASLFNALLDAGTCVILAEIAFMAFGSGAAMTTGILAAFYRAFIFYTPQVMKESLGLFLLALFALHAYRALKSQKWKTFFWCGICLGLCGVVRGNVLALAPVLLGFVFWKQDKNLRLKNGAVFVAGVIIALSPVTLQNALTSHDFVLTSYADGFNAYIGHGPTSTGNSYAFPHDVSSNPGSEEFNSTRLAEIAEGRRLKPSEVSTYWRDKAIDYAFEHPEHELSLLINKLQAFWSNDEPYDNYDMDFIARRFDTVISWPLADFGLVTAMAVFAAIALISKKRDEVTFFGAMIFIYMLTLIPFYVTDRYRLSVVIFLLPLAGGAAPAAYELYRTKDSRRMALAGLAAFIPFCTIFWPHKIDPLDDAFNWGTLCTVYEDEGYHIASLLALNEALAISPHNVGSDAWIKSTDALDHLGRHKEAKETLEKLESMYPADGTVPYNIGRLAFIDEDYPTAFLAFKKSVELAPTFALSYRGLAAVYDYYGYRSKALEAIQRGLDVVPGDPVLVEVIDKYK